MKKKVLITGCAGFIGFSVANKLLNQNYEVIGIDNYDDYYSVGLKKSRINILIKYQNFKFQEINICEPENVYKVFKEFDVEFVYHFAGQPGVRYSIQNPSVYIQSNIIGFFNILEACRISDIQHLIYASSSSVYGDGINFPYSTETETMHPLSLYAATKKSNEDMAHAYSHLYGFPTTGLRFFTVYGPWGRPDMALFKFTKSIIENKQIEVFNDGKLARDFTFIDDVVEACISIMGRIPSKSQNKKLSESRSSPWKIFNVGADKPVMLIDFIFELENALDKKAKIKYLPMQSGDVLMTHADIRDTTELTCWRPKTNLRDGIRAFVAWYIDYFNCK